MEWNQILRDLNYYLADLYQNDTGYRTTKRVIQGAGMLPQFISAFQDKPVSEWFDVLEYTRKRNDNKVIELLESILKEPDTSEDEFIKGAIKNLRENKDFSPGVAIKPGDWKEPKNAASLKEKIIGRRSNIIPIGFLKKGTRVASAVVRIVVGNELGTGFIVKNNWLVTNNHVIRNIQDARNAVIEFNYEFPEDEQELTITDIKPEAMARLNPGEKDSDGLFVTNAKEDWTIVKIADDVTKFGYVEISKREIAPEDFVNIIQHPSGGPKQLAIYNNMVMYVDKKDDGFIVQYLTDTLPGSSGSPVFNSNWEVVAIHHSGGWLKDPDIKTAVYRNQGTNINRIKSILESKES